MGNLNPNYMLGIYIWLGLYHKYYCTLWSFIESGYYSILTTVEVNGMQIRSTYVDGSCNRDISKIYWSCTLNIAKHPTPISFSALLLVIATDGEKKESCMNLEFVSPGLIISNNWINPTQTHYISKVAVDIWVLCLQYQKICIFILHLITSFHLATSVPVNCFCWLHIHYTKTEYQQWWCGLNNVIYAPTSNSRDKK
jgi:hypothetical protein